MKIAILGTGNVGSALGIGWAKAGHEVAYGSRNPMSETARALIEVGAGRIGVGSMAEATQGAQVVVIAVPWNAAQDTVRSAGELAGKIVVDCTNPVKGDLTGLTVGLAESAAEKIRSWALGALVVKAFNTMHATTMADPNYGGVAADCHIAGDDEKAKGTVAQLAQQLGFEVVDCGPLRASAWQETLAMLWIHLAFRQQWGTNFAFKVIRR